MSNNTHRFFKMNDQHGIIHLPERPNGFAISIIGDTNHFVSDHTSSWIHHPERRKFIEELCLHGYTVYYSNLYGRHWGNERSVELLHRLYHTIIKQEILNFKIHVFAEGMGALSALKWMHRHEGIIRSAAFMNPCFSLKTHGEAVMEQKLFYKQFRREISKAYELSEDEATMLLVKDKGMYEYPSTLPVKIWHNMQGTPYSFIKHSRAYEKFREEIGAPISLTLQLPGGKYDLVQKVKIFYQQNETEL
ncbi:alpha/beta hydrolase [Pseudalkalibacillus sp. A8]|uniref:alpha/beta hydrolase n=1 Tax=Pseudalkalibacillus sp. A8 TaxID=3382641 RepID=UPI0038B56564